MLSFEEKTIYLSKVKITFLIVLAIMFVVLGVWLLTLDPQRIENARRFNSPVLIYGTAIAAIVFFGLCGIVGVRKLFDNSPGLILTAEGIYDNSSGVSGGLIPWREVVGISEYQIQRQKFVSILVQDPEKYVKRGNALKRMTNRANIKMCGTPINISANALKISYAELLQSIQEYYQNGRSGA